MKRLKVRAKLLSGFFGLMFGIGSAHAAVVYDWSGSCNFGCTGTATAVLTLTDAYVPGAAVALSDLVSLSFSSSGLSYAVPGDTTFSDVSGTLPNGSSSVSFGVDFPGSGTSFSTTTGIWISQMTTGSTVGGTTNTWSLRATVSPVPLPASAWMFISSLLAFGLYGWWRRRRMAAEAQPA